MLWFITYLLPALLYKLFEWIYYKFWAKEPIPADRKTLAEKFPCPLANSGLPNPHGKKADKQEEVLAESANTSASESEVKTKNWWKACTSISWSHVTRWTRVWDEKSSYSWLLSLLNDTCVTVEMIAASLIMPCLSTLKQSILKSKGRYFAEFTTKAQKHRNDRRFDIHLLS